MPRVTIRDVGQYGIIRDIPAHELPPEAWSMGSNVTFRDKFAEIAPGESAVLGTLSVAPRKLVPMLLTDGHPRWVYCGLDDVYAITMGEPITHTNITRAAGVYTGTILDRWNSAWLNGLLILNNGVDVPQYWNGNTWANLANLTNWPSGWTAKVVRAFGNFLLALNVTKSSTRYPTLLSWSHPADPGSVPPSWDVSDSTKLTGDKTFTNTGGKLVDCLPLRDANIVYKEDAIILQQFIGGNEIFGWRDISIGTGLAGQNCVAEFKPGYHVLLTSDYDVVVCNGQTVESVIEDRMRRSLQAHAPSEYLDQSFLFQHPLRHEIWVCPVTTGASNMAFVWNYKTGAWGRRELFGAVDGVTGWYGYDASSYTHKSREALMIFSEETAAYKVNASAEISGAEVYLHRDGLAIIGQARDGTPRVDYTKHKVVTEIWPLIEAPPGTTFTITIDATNSTQDLINNFPNGTEQEFTFVVGTDVKVDCLVEGKFINIRFATASDQLPWKLHGYSLEVNVVGEYV